MKEKMLLGELYNGADIQLTKDRINAKTLCMDYNKLYPDKLNERKEILKKLFHSVGENCYIEPNFFCDYGYNISIGNDFYMNHNGVILDCNKVTIGNHCYIGPNVGIYTAYHPLDVEIRNKNLEQAKEIVIKDNVWIGGNVTILPGVVIGDNCVIGAGSVVTHSISDNTLAFGNPCREIKKI